MIKLGFKDYASIAGFLVLFAGGCAGMLSCGAVFVIACFSMAG